MAKNRKIRLVPLLLLILPVGLIATTTFALIKYFKDEKKDLLAEQMRFAQSVSSEAIEDDMRKFIKIIGERNMGRPNQLKSAAAMIEGGLGPSNTGFDVNKIQGPDEFPLLQVTVSSKNKTKAPVWVLSSYDSPRGSSGAEQNASGLAATIATAQALAESNTAADVHFLFLPHVNDLDAPVVETAQIAAQTIKKTGDFTAVLCVEAMGEEETLILSSRNTDAIPSREFEGLGKILGAEITCLGEDFHLSSTLNEMDIPALRIATRPTLLPDEDDEKVPFAPTVSAATGRLVKLVERLAR